MSDVTSFANMLCTKLNDVANVIDNARSFELWNKNNAPLSDIIDIAPQSIPDCQKFLNKHPSVHASACIAYISTSKKTNVIWNSVRINCNAYQTSYLYEDQINAYCENVFNCKIKQLIIPNIIEGYVVKDDTTILTDIELKSLVLRSAGALLLDKAYIAPLNIFNYTTLLCICTYEQYREHPLKSWNILLSH